VLRFIKYCLLALVLLLVCFSSALLSMRFAIHGREVRVPRLVGLAPIEAERQALSQGLVVSIESHFYSPNIPEGYIVVQSPDPGAKVRRGWKVRVAQSLGPQRASVPNVLGESERVAELNISRRGLEIGTAATIHLPGSQPETVVAQSPPADAHNAVSPKVSLLIAAPDNGGSYLMPNFVGQPIAETQLAVVQSGFILGKINYVKGFSGSSGTILKQNPPAGTRIAAGATITFEVSE
jgi:eukaryotic-like serine/threonine-protein kinase